MKLSLTAVIFLFCVTKVFALPPTESYNVIARTDDGLDLSDVDIVDVEYNPEDFETLETRDTSTIKCSNDGKIKRVKKEYAGKCNPSNSKGFKSAHNCQNQSGKSYLCVQSKKATCYTIAKAESKNFEKGECFIRK